jgi:hypothetical protein
MNRKNLVIEREIHFYENCIVRCEFADDDILPSTRTMLNEVAKC